MLVTSEAWKAAYPGASIGLLAMHDVANPEEHPGLDEHKQALENDLRSQYAGYDRARFKALPTMQAYNAYYRRFTKSYHVQLQLESIVLRDKSIPRVAALVESMFMAELKNGLLTAGHDLERVRAPVRVDVAGESEQYTRLNGQDQTLKAGDMMIADAEGILSSIIYGPDRRTCINPQTRRVLFTVYAPPGIEQEAVTRHLGDIRDNVLLFAPQAEVVLLRVYGSEGTA
ncbi:MAG: hypothetical protein ISS56_20355 [Anaerolineae bacterium]|nr:hypothetical protein [Anaerolineae bacterium]